MAGLPLDDEVVYGHVLRSGTWLNIRDPASRRRTSESSVSQDELDASAVGSVVMALWYGPPMYWPMQKYSDGWFGFLQNAAAPAGHRRPW